MKYNPKINEKIARIPGLSAIHPLQDERTVQGALELLYDLSEHLEEITGMDEVTLQPAAGAHGEWTGLMMIRAFHEANGDHKRTKVIVLIRPTVQTRRLRLLPDLKRSPSNRMTTVLLISKI